VAGVTALQAVRDLGRVRAGQRVLVNGASGGVGTFAVQIAKALGAEVTGVSSTRNLELVRSLGAAHVIDYTRDDFTMGDRPYDVVIDAVGNRDLGDIRRVMTPDGICVIVGGGGPERSFLGPVAGLLGALVYDRVVSQQFLPFLAEVSQERLNALADLVRSGAVRPVIDRRYAFDEAVDAVRYLETGRARGKVLVTVAPGSAVTSH
jgi:NADPH:quinone reductase-like Zn-dependent oxidoreductase